VIGGALYLTGWLLLAYNVWRTIRGAQAVNGSIEVYADEGHATERPLGLGGTILNPPVVCLQPRHAVRVRLAVWQRICQPRPACWAR